MSADQILTAIALAWAVAIAVGAPLVVIRALRGRRLARAAYLVPAARQRALAFERAATAYEGAGAALGVLILATIAAGIAAALIGVLA